MLPIQRRQPRSLGSIVISAGALALLLAVALSAPAGAAGIGAQRLATITRGGLTVAVPPRGMGVVASALMADGSVRELRVETGIDGQALVVADPDAASQSGAAAVSPAGSPPACADRKHVVNSSWWHQTFHWSFKSASKPSNISASTAERELKRAVDNITGEHNDCGRTDHVSATSVYDGRTTRGTQITSNSLCSGTDGHNTVAFGDLSGSAVGFSCWWFIGDTTVEADMQLNKHDFRWAVTPSSCSSAYLVQDVATHEFGHIFGLGHANSQSAHANLTMSPAVYFCDNSDETLGLGDMLGLEVHY